MIRFLSHPFRAILFVLFLCGLPLALQSQKYYIVKGQIYDQKDKLTLPQAQVVLIGASGAGAVADMDGNYVFTADKPRFTLQFRYLGYADKEVEVAFAPGEDVKILSARTM